MKQRLSNLEGIVASLRPYLPEYLQGFGIDTNKNFKCLNPKHQDSTPSMTCKSKPEAAYCFSCGFVADLFTAAHVLEGKPLSGKGWIEENVLYLAKKFGVDVQLEELTPEELVEYRTYKAYELAAQLVSDINFGDYQYVDKEIERRSWDKNKLSVWGVGTVNYEDFREALKRAGFEQSFLAAIDLDRPNLFNNHNLIFTVYDEDSRAVGFSAKNLRHDKTDKSTGPKYINTRNTGLDYAIFKKGERLYGFNLAKDAKSPLYIFEGQANVITARHFGMANCCCTMGIALTEDHIALLKRHGIFSIVLVFDGDAPGQFAIQKVLDEKFSKERDFRIKLCSLPSGKDPDELIREEGFDAFVRLKKWTAFEWRLMKFTESIDGDLEDERRREIAEGMIPIIASEKSHIRQEEMIKQVAKVTGYETGTIGSEVRRLRNEKEADTQARKVNAVESILSKVRYSPENIEVALAECQVAIEAINKKANNPEESSSVLSSVLSLKEMDEAKTGAFSGFFMKRDGLGIIASRLDDDWRSGNLVFIGSAEQGGKTSMCSQMSYEIADDPRNEAICIYHSIDDAMKYIVYKWICNASNGFDITLNMIGNPNYWSQQPGFEYIRELREQAYKKILRMIQEERLVIKDASDGPGLAYSESLVKLYRERHPDKNIVLFLDNFHKLPDYGEINGHERVKRLSNHLKNMTIVHRATIVSTVEYRKLQAGEKPSNVALAECLVEDSIIINAQTGERVKIKDIEPGTLVNTIENETFKIVPKKIKNKVFKGVQDCFEVVLENGFSIRGTQNHPLLKDNGQWTQIKNLKIGDYLGVPSKQPILSEDKEYYSSEIARFLGYMAGDGNYGTGKDSKNQVSTPRFTNSEKEIYEDICSIVENNFPEIRINQNDHLGSKEIKFSRNSGKINNKVKAFLQEENLWGELGEKKTIPAKIFKSNNIIKANYLAGLYLSDGSISSENTSIRFFNTSKDLIYGARELLLQLGISSSISMIKEENPKHKDGYTLRVNNHDIEKFKSIVPFVGNKNNRLKEIDISNAISHTGSRDNLSLYFAEEIHKHHKNTDGLSVWLSYGQKKYAHQLVPHSKINRATFEKYKNSFSVPKELERFTSEDVIWLQIKSINSIGEYPTYDLEIEDTHNFIADGIFCHNSRSLAYDANVILHLYNDLHINGENSATVLHYDAAGKALPRIWVKFGKNKVSGYEGREFLDLYPANAQFKSIDTEQALQELKERTEYLKLNKHAEY